MRRFFIFYFLITLFLPGELFAKVDVGFTPSSECEQKISNLIEKSQVSIDIAIYSINNTQLVEQLIKANKRGVKIRILADRLQASSKYSKVIELKLNGLDVKIHTKNKIEHNKFAIFDGHIVSTGSFNWTNAATKNNSENCLFLLDDPDNVKKFKERFEELWSMNTQEKSDAWFNKRMDKK